MKSFTPRSLLAIRDVLLPPVPPTPSPPHTVSSSKPPTESAVLIPLMNVDNTAHVLMQVRATGMRVHAGEVSFPGGKADRTDRDLVHTALRETQEELGIPPSDIEMLGMLEPEYSLGNKSRVWPFVGFVRPQPHRHPSRTPSPSSSRTTAFEPLAEDDPLPSYPLSTLRLSPNEVSALLPLPLSALQDPERHSLHFFRLNTMRPYHRIRVPDLAIPYDSFPSELLRHPIHDAGKEVGEKRAQQGEGRDGVPRDLEVWGLSGWFLNKLAERARWLVPPPVPPSPED